LPGGLFKFTFAAAKILVTAQLRDMPPARMPADLGTRQRVQSRFARVNPNGPLHAVTARRGDRRRAGAPARSRRLHASGINVNDAGNQMENLGLSIVAPLPRVR